MLLEKNYNGYDLLVNCSFMELPLFVESGMLICLGPRQGFDYDLVAYGRAHGRDFENSNYSYRI